MNYAQPRGVEDDRLYKHENTGTRAIDMAREDARNASSELKERLDKAVFKFGWRHGITTDEARHLLLNTGVRLA